MKVKNKLCLPITLAICFLTAAAIYGQEANRNDTAFHNALIFSDTAHTRLDTAFRSDTTIRAYFPFRFSIDTMAIDTTRVPYLSAKGIRFSDSLRDALKNSLSTLFEKNESPQTHIPPFFTSKQPKFWENLAREKPTFDWFFAALILFLSTLAFLRLQIPTLFPALWNKKKQRNLYQRTENLSKILLFLLQVFASWVVFSLALTEILSYWKFLFPFEPLFFSSVIVFIYIFAKFFLKKISSWLFQMGDIASEHLSIVVNANFSWGLAAFFLVVINHYAANDYLIWIICAVFCINFLQKLVLEWMIFSKKLRFFEILLYLCTIEILPLLLLARYVVNYF